MSTTPDPVVEAYGSYTQGDSIFFERTLANFYGRGSKRRMYAYRLSSQQLWRVYVRDKRNMNRIASWQVPMTYIRQYRLEPVIPTYLKMDEGL